MNINLEYTLTKLGDVREMQDVPLAGVVAGSLGAGILAGN
jgi:hypothetical protein